VVATVAQTAMAMWCNAPTASQRQFRLVLRGLSSRCLLSVSCACVCGWVGGWVGVGGGGGGGQQGRRRCVATPNVGQLPRHSADVASPSFCARATVGCCARQRVENGVDHRRIVFDAWISLAPDCALTSLFRGRQSDRTWRRPL
jgi:hypothetical protein